MTPALHRHVVTTPDASLANVQAFAEAIAFLFAVDVVECRRAEEGVCVTFEASSPDEFPKIERILLGERAVPG